MPSISPISQSPIAKFLLKNKAVAKRIDRDTIQFLSQDNSLLGEMKKSGYRGERQIITTIFDKQNNPILEKLTIIKKYVKDLIINEKNCAVVPEGYTTYTETKDITNNTIKTEIKTKKLVSDLKEGKYKCSFPIYNIDGKIKYADVPNESLELQTKYYTSC